MLRSEIVGAVKMRVYLSGMPELRLGLNDKVLFESTGREFSSSQIKVIKPKLRPLHMYLEYLYESDLKYSPHMHGFKFDPLC